MIKQLVLQNFQSHKDTELNFSDGVNIIVGPSDSGKSAILRAIKLLVWNRPSGNEMRSTWGGKTSVEIFTDDVHIVRVKDKEEIYILGDQHFKAFRTDVPKEIQDALNLSEINLQQQLDSPFLLSLSPGQVAQHFNSIAKLDQIDTGLFNINKAIRELEGQNKYKQIDLDNKKEELVKYEHIEKLEAEIEVLEQMQNQLRSLQNSKQVIDSKIYDYKQADSFIRQHKVLLADEDKVNDLLALIEKKNKLIESQRNLKRNIKELSSIAQKIKQEQEYIQDEPLVTALLTQYKTLKPLNEAFFSLSKLIKRINYIKGLIQQEQQNLTTLESKFHKLMPDICPLCGQSIKQ
jgi:DNA repair protein SbcC/Rad50